VLVVLQQPRRLVVGQVPCVVSSGHAPEGLLVKTHVVEAPEPETVVHSGDVALPALEQPGSARCAKSATTDAPSNLIALT
jgi:hypothetical protein